jgi:hypothetical protein
MAALRQDNDEKSGRGMRAFLLSLSVKPFECDGSIGAAEAE